MSSANSIHSVFLDTNVFEGAQFKYENNNLENFFVFCKKYNIPIYINQVIYREVKKRIAMKVNEIVKVLKKEHFDYLNRIVNINKDIAKELHSEMISEFETLIENKILIFLPLDYNQEELIAMYFDEVAPFNVDRKKSEFPDAISLLTVKNFINESSENILFVSNDHGILQFCNEQGILSCEYIGRALNKLNDQFNLNKLFTKYQATIESNIKKIISEDLALNIYGYTYEDYVDAEGTINNVQVNELNLIKEDDENLLIVIGCNATIDLDIETSPYPDYDMGMYDREDSVWYIYSSLKTTFSHQIVVDLNFDVEIEDIHEGILNISCNNYDIDVEFNTFDIPSGKIINQIHLDDH